MRNAKIQFRGQLDRARPEPLARQLVQQLREAIESGQLRHDARLPSTRALAHSLGVSRNTVLTAYEELVALGIVRGRPGAGMFVRFSIPRVDVRAVMREAQFPTVTIAIRDVDRNSIYISY